jgi:pyruvate,water dikinase
MLQNLTKIGIKIPDGFVITTNAYNQFVQYNNLDEEIRGIVKKIDYANIESLRRAGLAVRNLIKNARFPSELSRQIIDAYYVLSKKYGQDTTDVAVRSSATAEDLPDASFRSAGNISECARSGFAYGCRPQLFCFPVYRPGYFLPGEFWL